MQKKRAAFTGQLWTCRHESNRERTFVAPAKACRSQLLIHIVHERKVHTVIFHVPPDALRQQRALGRVEPQKEDVELVNDPDLPANCKLLLRRLALVEGVAVCQTWKHLIANWAMALPNMVVDARP